MASSADDAISNLAKRPVIVLSLALLFILYIYIYIYEFQNLTKFDA